MTDVIFKPEDFFPLSDKTFVPYATFCYDGGAYANFIEFDEDLARIRHIKKLLTRYMNTGELKERITLNHILVLGNVFGIAPSLRLLCYKLEDYHLPFLCPFLDYLGYLPRAVNGLKKIVVLEGLQHDPGIVAALKKI